jgi:ABC-type polysaccharide/polyol phosphate transport system ATPase subunit
VTAVVELSGVGKRFIKYEDAPMLVTAALRLRQRTRRSSLWAVRGVDLTLDEGECLGLIGRNGSGKSTLLSMLAGVTAPTEGVLAVRGRVAPLISVGVGFHPELTGRENVYVNGMILGMTRRELDASLDEIVAFSELEDFLDTPVKFYSSGMFVRLGFAVAVQSRPDVLLVDEVLAVGDLAFQLKCYDRMLAIRDAGTSIVVVSHNLNAVRLMCPRTGIMAGGQLRFLGPTNDAISVYHDLLGESRELDPVNAGELPPERPGVAVIEGVELLDGEGRPTRHLAGGDRMVLRVRLRIDAVVDDPYLGVAVTNESGNYAYTDSTRELLPHPVEAGSTFTAEVALRVGLVTGSYNVQVGLSDGVAARLAVSRQLPFFVSSRPAAAGVADLEGTFRLL